MIKMFVLLLFSEDYTNFCVKNRLWGVSTESQSSVRGSYICQGENWKKLCLGRIAHTSHTVCD